MCRQFNKEKKGKNMNNAYRTFIYKIGDIEADSKIQTILGEGWKISTITPNGSVRITTFNKDFSASPEKKMARTVVL